MSLRITILAMLTGLTGCVRAPTPEVYFRVGAAHLDDNASMVVLPFYIANLPGNATEYEAAISAGMQTCGRRCIPLQSARAALASAKLEFPHLPADLFRAAARGEVDLNKIRRQNLKRDFAALIKIVQDAAHALGVEFRPRYLLAVRVDGLGRQNTAFRFRVTAAICDLQQHKLHAVASFVRTADESWLVSEMGQLGLRVIAALARPPGAKPQPQKVIARSR